MNEHIKKFLKELTELSNKYGITINGCGCCGSPWLKCGNGDVYENLSMNNGVYDGYYVPYNLDGDNDVV